jgi:hypothetical protein
MEDVNQEKVETPVQNETKPADLNLNDLAALRSIVEVASSRGAFKAAELEAVGKAFNKLNLFLESVSAKKE